MTNLGAILTIWHAHYYIAAFSEWSGEHFVFRKKLDVENSSGTLVVTKA